MKLYGELARWWPVLRPAEAFEDIAVACFELLGRPESLLELGSGSGQLASHLPCGGALVDRSEQMLAVSRELNPGWDHVAADLLTLSLGRRFAAVLLHDAVMYLTSEDELLAAFVSAHRHLESSGRFLVVPDVVREDWEEGLVSGGTLGDPGAHLVEWHWDPDPDDSLTRVELSLLLREQGQVRAIHESHDLGVYPRSTYWRLLRQAGFVPVEADPVHAVTLPEAFLCRPA